MKETDERYTPEWVLDIVREFGGIGLDPCAPVGRNPTGATHTLTIRDDALDSGTTWGDVGNVWVNPPYSVGQLPRWVDRVIEQAYLGAGRNILMITPADVSTRWFRVARESCDSVCLMHRRVGFVMPDGTQLPGAKFGSAVWYWGPRRSRFARVWEPHGWVVPGPGVQEEVVGAP